MSPARKKALYSFVREFDIPDREETRAWSGNNFLVARAHVAVCARVGVTYCIMRENLIWREFNLAIFYNSPNRQINVLAKFSGYTVLISQLLYRTPVVNYSILISRLLYILDANSKYF